MSRWRLVVADADGNGSPTTGQIGNQVTAKPLVQALKKGFVEREQRKATLLDVLLDLECPLGQQRGKLLEGQDTERRFYEARAALRRCSSSSHCQSTGSPSNAMLKAT